MQVAILAGGAGTRLKSVTGDKPKPLAEVAGVPMIGRQVALVAENGASRVTVVAGYGAAALRDYLGDGERFGIAVDWLEEPRPMGTAGATLAAPERFDADFIVLYGDVVLDVDLARLWAHHKNAKADATLFVHPNDHPHDSDLIAADGNDRITGFHPYPHPPGALLANLVNAGLYVLRREGLRGLDLGQDKPDFAKHVFPRMIAAGRALAAYRSPEYIKDAGTPERIGEVSADIVSGRVARMSLRAPAPAVFLDRDGTINIDRNRISRAEDFDLVPGSGAAIRRLNASGLRTIVITNQPVIARGDCDEAELARIHARMDMALARDRAFVDRLYYCPHHPDKGFPGEVAALKIVCDCRKPATGLIDRATRDLNVDRTRSWMIGDSTTDIELARRAGLRSVLVATGHGGRDRLYKGRPDFSVADLADAARLILETWPTLRAKAEAEAPRIAPGGLVLVGGLAHSGKSSFASALAIVLKARGQGAVVVALDNWLKDEAARGPGVLGRYDGAAAEAAILALHRGRTTIHAPAYDAATRASTPDAIAISAAPGDVIIAEGVPALALAGLVARAARKLHVTCPDAGRRARFDAVHRARGLDAATIDLLYDQRQGDETPVVAASAARADAVVELEG